MTTTFAVVLCAAGIVLLGGVIVTIREKRREARLRAFRDHCNAKVFTDRRF